MGVRKQYQKGIMQDGSMQLPKTGEQQIPKNLTFVYKESMQLLDVPPQLTDT